MTNTRVRSPLPIRRMDQDIENQETLTHLFGELQICNLESTKHPRHPTLPHDKLRNTTVATHDRPISEKQNPESMQTSYTLGIDISKEDTLHTLTKPRGRDGTENLAARHITWRKRNQPPLHPILRTNQEKHPHPPIRRIVYMQPGIYKTPQAHDFTLRKNAQHYCLYPK